MSQTAQLVVFEIDGQKFALHLSVVQRIVRAVAITPLPQAPAIVLGIINVQGQIVPVFNVRERFQFPPRVLGINDQFIIAQAAGRTVALLVDAASGVVTDAVAATVPGERILPHLEYVEGVVKCADGLILIHNLDRFLSLTETQQLDAALPAESGAS